MRKKLLLFILAIGGVFISTNAISQENMEEIHISLADPNTERIRKLLEDFCKTEYNRCYSGSIYIERSLEISEFDVDPEKVIFYFKGRHSFKIGKETYSNRRFKAQIQQKQNKDITVTFVRWYDLGDMQPHWETACTKIY